jgi:hypothetical protein
MVAETGTVWRRSHRLKLLPGGTVISWIVSRMLRLILVALPMVALGGSSTRLFWKLCGMGSSSLINFEDTPMI